MLLDFLCFYMLSDEFFFLNVLLMLKVIMIELKLLTLSRVYFEKKAVIKYLYYIRYYLEHPKERFIKYMATTVRFIIILIAKLIEKKNLDGKLFFRVDQFLICVSDCLIGPNILLYNSVMSCHGHTYVIDVTFMTGAQLK